MADETWQKVREIFDSALRRGPEERREFVSGACSGDKDLLDEVESLLASLDSAENFMETPAVAEVADAISGNGNKLEKGHSLGHYEIVEPIGTGGMGEVYLAKDQKLDRKVAVKILNEKFSSDESNLSRFIREAQAASALNHPNILVIHEIGEAEGAHFIVSEYIKGRTLREVLKEKTLNLSEVLDVSIQIANALAAAHEAHLIHRDIKPENVMIRPDRFVKVLDFGLAKLVEQKNKSILGLDESTLEQNQTAKGVIMGTVKYMSPEQAKGERVDERTDIFSLGVVIYEMIAGTTPFAGDSMSDTFANLINAQPSPLSRFSPNVPNELQRIVSKMLRKNKDERFQTMKGLLTDLKDLRDNLTSEERLERTSSPNVEIPTVALQATTAEAKQKTAETQNSFSQRIGLNRKFAITTLATLLIVSIGTGAYFLDRAKAPFVFQAGEIKRLTTNGRVASAAFSPDGKFIVYAQKESGDQQSLWMQRIGNDNALQVAPPANIEYQGLVITPDGNTLYYIDGNRTLYQTGVLGGRVRKIAEKVGRNSGQSKIAISPDGKEIATARRNEADEFVMVIMNADGTNERTLFTFEAMIGMRTFSWSPDGKVIACQYGRFGSAGAIGLNGVLGIQAADGKYAPIVTPSWSEILDIVWLPDSQSLAIAGTSLKDNIEEAGTQIWQIPYPAGERRRISTDSNSYVSLGIAADGLSLIALRTDQNALIETTNDAGVSEPKRLTTGSEKQDGVLFLDWLADGRIVFDSWASEKYSTLAIEPGGANTRQLTSGITGRAISNDGNSLIFTKLNVKGVWSMDLRTGSERRLLPDGRDTMVFTPDDKWIVFTGIVITGLGEKFGLLKVPADGGEPMPLLEQWAVSPAVSPDGKMVAFTGPAAGRGIIGLVSIDGGKIIKRFEVRPEKPEYSGKRALQWTPDGRAINYVALNNGVSNVWRQPIDGGPPVQITKFQTGRIFNFAYSRDGKQLALSRGTLNSDVVLFKNSN